MAREKCITSELTSDLNSEADDAGTPKRPIIRNSRYLSENSDEEDDYHLKKKPKVIKTSKQTVSSAVEEAALPLPPLDLMCTPPPKPISSFQAVSPSPLCSLPKSQKSCPAVVSGIETFTSSKQLRTPDDKGK